MISETTWRLQVKWGMESMFSTSTLLEIKWGGGLDFRDEWEYSLCF